MEIISKLESPYTVASFPGYRRNDDASVGTLHNDFVWTTSTSLQ